MIYLELLWSFFQIGLFSIGGGYAAIPLIQQQVVELHPWLTLGEFTDLITISQMTPGPIAINSATFVGTQIAGVGGAVVSTLGCILPSCAIVLTLAYFYYKYRNLTVIQNILAKLRPAVVSLIGSAGVSIGILAFWNSGAPNLDPTDINWVGILLFAAAFFVLRKFKSSPVMVMAGCGIAGMFLYPFL